MNPSLLTHINHSNPLGNESARITATALAAGFRVAFDGLILRAGDLND